MPGSGYELRHLSFWLLVDVENDTTLTAGVHETSHVSRPRIDPSSEALFPHTACGSIHLPVLPVPGYWVTWASS